MADTSGREGSAVVGIVTILDEERAALCNALGAQRRGQYWVPQNGSKFVIRQSADRSNGPAMTATRILIEQWRPEVVLLVGIAGGIGERGPWLGDVVVPDYLHYAEFRKLSGGRDDARYCAYDQPTVSVREEMSNPVRLDDVWHAGLPARPVVDDDLRDHPRVFADGPLVAAEKLMGDPEHPEQRRLVSNYSNALAIDMESFGVARAVHEARSDPGYNPRLLVIRGVSDLVKATAVKKQSMSKADQEANQRQRDQWKEYAAAAAAAFARAVVEEYAP
jgi:nucleoside phosphorylase